MNSNFGNQMEHGEIELSEAKKSSEMPLCNISLPFSVLKSENSDKGMPKIRMSLPSFSGRTEDYPHLLKYSCDIECSTSPMRLICFNLMGQKILQQQLEDYVCFKAIDRRTTN
ncbi:protein NEOXANTHIN-DEFICIENT 1-like [Carex rostrata]